MNPFRRRPRPRSRPLPLRQSRSSPLCRPRSTRPPQPSLCRSRPRYSRLGLRLVIQAGDILEPRLVDGGLLYGAQGEKVDTVEFAIAPHPEEPEEAEPAPIPVEEPAIDETRLQDVSGLYDEPEAKPARRRKAGTTRRTTRKKASDEPQEELNSPAFDNFEGVDFDS